MGPIFWGQVQQVYDLLGPGGMSSNETDDECGPTGIKMVRRVARVSPEKFHPCGTKLKITTMFGNDQSVEDAHFGLQPPFTNTYKYCADFSLC